MSPLSLYGPWKHHKTRFSDVLKDIERDQWHEMAQDQLRDFKVKFI